MHHPSGTEEERDLLPLQIDVHRNRYPFSIVWGLLPPITWCLPVIGHMGICDSKGIVHDFAGPYHIGIDDFMTGPVLTYVQMNPCTVFKTSDREQAAQLWDQAIQKADQDYCKLMHNICCNNCHHHVARALRYMGQKYSMLGVWWLLITRGKWVSIPRFISAYCGIIILVLILVIYYSTTTK